MLRGGELELGATGIPQIWAKVICDSICRPWYLQAENHSIEHLCAGEKLAACLESQEATEGYGGGDNMVGPGVQMQAPSPGLASPPWDGE